MEERDPLKSQAIESSLWELQALQNHILPSVATAAKFINMPLPSVEWDMSRILENSADDVSTLYCDSSAAVHICMMIRARCDVLTACAEYYSVPVF